MSKGLIIGAGITGLAAGRNTGFPIYEATGKPGGICRSYYKGGYRFENGGGHWIFGTDNIKQYIEGFIDLNHYERRASVYFNQFFDYPIQEYIEREEGYYPGSMKGWLFEKFGFELCKIFFWPFNHKYTDGLFDEIIQDDPAKTPTAMGKGYNSKFSYPNKGGLDNLVDRMANGLDIHYDRKLVALDLRDHQALFEGGEVVEYDRLISTIPLKGLLSIAGTATPDLLQTSVLVLNIGAERGPQCPMYHWVYIPDPECKFFRVGFYSNVDPAFAPIGKVSIYVERALSNPKDMSILTDEVVDILSRWGWIGKVDVVDESFIPCGYTWLRPGHKREEYLKFLADNDVLSIGRYGKWKFQGIAESIQDGLNA